MDLNALIQLVYLLSALAFLLAFKLLSDQATAERGNFIMAVGIGAAMVVTLMDERIERFEYLFFGLAAGVIGGALMRRFSEKTPLARATLLNGFGGLAALLVAWSEFQAHAAGQGFLGGVFLWLTAVFGAISFSGSTTIWAKLEEKIATTSTAFKSRRNLFLTFLAAILLTGLLFASDTVAPDAYRYFAVFVILSLIFGVILSFWIKLDDTQTVAYLLNACSGAATCAAGFIFQNPLLVAAGGLVGAMSVGMALEICKEKNRPLGEALFG